MQHIPTKNNLLLFIAEITFELITNNRFYVNLYQI